MPRNIFNIELGGRGALRFLSSCGSRAQDLDPKPCLHSLAKFLPSTDLSQDMCSIFSKTLSMHVPIAHANIQCICSKHIAADTATPCTRYRRHSCDCSKHIRRHRHTVRAVQTNELHLLVTHVRRHRHTVCAVQATHRARGADERVVPANHVWPPTMPHRSGGADGRTEYREPTSVPAQSPLSDRSVPAQ